MLKQLIDAVKQNMTQKGKSVKDIALTLYSIRQHYNNDELFNPTPPPEEVPIDPGPTREERVLAMEKHYAELGEKTGKWVFSPATATKLGASSRQIFGRTDLHVAVSTGDLKAVRSLLEKKANTKARDNSGYTPYQHALLEGNQGMVDLFHFFGIKK